MSPVAAARSSSDGGERAFLLGPSIAYRTEHGVKLIDREIQRSGRTS
jgi:hypothetical protein